MSRIVTYVLSVWHFLWQNGVGQNLTAGVITAAIALGWSRTRYWPLHLLHEKLDRIERSHAALHEKLDEHERLHEGHAAKLAAIARRLPPER